MLQSLRHCLTAVVFLCAFSTPSAYAEVPSRLVVQGYLTDISTLRPLHGTFDVVVTLYDMSGRTTDYQTAGGTVTDPQGLGAVLWTETQVITAEDGRYSVVLGDDASNPLPEDLLGSDQVELGLAIDGDSEMTPRLAVTSGSVPYALQAREAEQVNGDITPRTISIADDLVINEFGEWVGPDSGLIGPKGDTGDAGPPGADGVDGATGPKGDTGAQGPAGPVGDTGAVGPQGPAGPQGPTGADGATGPKGDTGTQGPAGPIGDTGPQGPIGTPGMMGPPGPMGPTGMTGPAGTFSTSNVAQKACTSATSCQCDSGVVLAGGVQCASNSYITNSYPSAAGTWSGSCETWQTGAAATPSAITITCAVAN